MKAIVTLDDLDVASGQGALPHTVQVRLGWDGTWYELDLTDFHAEELWEAVRPYLEAGRREEHQPLPRPDAKALTASQQVPVAKGVALHHAAGVPMRVYVKGLRKWAADTGVELETYVSPGGIRSYKYQAEHYRGYEAWLSDQDRLRMTG